MNFKPILFSTPMVQAILGGRKTMTRRVIKYSFETVYSAACYRGKWSETYKCKYGEVPGHVIEWYIKEVAKPAYQPGDILWVRETWQSFFPEEVTQNHQQGPRSFSGIPAETAKGHYMYFYYRADGEVPDDPKYGKANWRPSIFMPRGAARIFLRVTDVRAERVQDITETDAKAEGAVFTDYGIYQPKWKASLDGGKTFYPAAPAQHPGWHMAEVNSPDQCYPSARSAFIGIWDSLNAKRGFGWDTNPWVWVYIFERCEKPEGIA